MIHARSMKDEYEREDIWLKRDHYQQPWFKFIATACNWGEYILCNRLNTLCESQNYTHTRLFCLWMSILYGFVDLWIGHDSVLMIDWNRMNTLKWHVYFMITIRISHKIHRIYVILPKAITVHLYLNLKSNPTETLFKLNKKTETRFRIMYTHDFCRFFLYFNLF